MLEGWKDIARFIESIWGVSVSEDSAYRYSKQKDHPLPVRRIHVPGTSGKPRVSAESAKIEDWARRAIRETI